MKINSASNPKYADSTNSAINLDVNFEDIGTVPFSSSLSDHEAHGRDLFTRAKAGEFGPVAPFVPYVKTPSEIEQAESNKAKADITVALSTALPQILAYIAAKPDAPATLKTLASQIDAFKLKVK